MATTVHIPDPLLKRIDRRADRLKVSRNRFIVDSLERALETDDEWPQGVADLFRPVDSATAQAFDASMRQVMRHRTRARPRKL